jgi:hypothetical protein
MSDALAAISRQFDSYSRTARLKPGLLLILGPAAVAIGAGAPEWPAVTGLTTAVVGMGLPFAFADWIRRRGQRLQQELWSAWGGNPVVVALRGGDLVAQRRRAALAAATGLPLEDRDSPDFDEVAGNAVRRLISATRDTSKYALIFVENKAYGFARNALAVRSIGVRVSTGALIVAVVLIGISTKLDRLSVFSSILGAVVAAATTAFWVWYPSEQNVRAAAEDYRDRLLEALDSGAMSLRPP